MNLIMTNKLNSLKNIIFNLKEQPKYDEQFREYQCTTIINQELIENLNNIEDNKWFNGYVDVNSKSVPISNIRNSIINYEGNACTFLLSNISNYFANNIKEYLARNKANLLRNSKINFFIYEDKYTYGDENVPDEIQNFLNLIEYIKFLKKVADYSDNSTVFFISTESVTVKIDIENINLDNNSENLKKFINMFDEKEKYYDEKKRILKKIIVSFLSNVNDDNFFSCLWNHLDIICSKFIDNYYLFVESKDIDSVIKETREKKVKYISELNKVFSETRNILTLFPAFISFILYLYFRMPKDNQNWMYDTIFIICFTAYYSFIWIFIYNHEKYIFYIKKEIESYIDELKQLYCNLTINSKLEPHISDLQSSIKIIIISFKFIKIILILIGIMFIFFIFYNIHF